MVIFPGKTIGVLGSGQLGRMMALAARRMGYRIVVYSPDKNTPAGAVADLEISAPYEHKNSLLEFAKAVDVVTVEFENIPASSLELLGQHVPVRPKASVLSICQHRLSEKNFLFENKIPVTPFRAVKNLNDATAALKDLGPQAVLKTAGFGYDGKGQRMIRKAEDLTKAISELSGSDFILESLVDYRAEASVVCARGVSGEYADWGVIENRHSHHILDVSSWPAELPDEIQREASRWAKVIVDKLGVIGVFCVEFFVTKDNQVWVNELAPRPHNSGHLTIEASVTSQFEQQVRAICGLPLGSTERILPAAMANLLGDRWLGKKFETTAFFAEPSVKLHLYGKEEARVGRKMGHLTALANSVAEARDKVIKTRETFSGA